MSKRSWVLLAVAFIVSYTVAFMLGRLLYLSLIG